MILCRVDGGVSRYKLTISRFLSPDLLAVSLRGGDPTCRKPKDRLTSSIADIRSTVISSPFLFGPGEVPHEVGFWTALS